MFFHYNSSVTWIIQSWWCGSLSSLQQQHIHCFYTAKQQGNCTYLCTDPVTASWPSSSLQTRVLLSSNTFLSRSLRNVSQLKNHQVPLHLKNFSLSVLMFTRACTHSKITLSSYKVWVSKNMLELRLWHLNSLPLYVITQAFLTGFPVIFTQDQHWHSFSDQHVYPLFNK